MPARSVGPSTSVSSVAGGRASSSFYRQREDSRQITVHWSGRPRGVTFDATLGLDDVISQGVRYFKLDASREYELLEGPSEDANAVSHRVFDDIDPQSHVYLHAVPIDDDGPAAASLVQAKREEAPPTPVTPAVGPGSSSFRHSPTPPVVEVAPIEQPEPEPAPQPVSSGTLQAMAEDARQLGLLADERRVSRDMSLPDSDDEVLIHRYKALPDTPQDLYAPGATQLDPPAPIVPSSSLAKGEGKTKAPREDDEDDAPVASTSKPAKRRKLSSDADSSPRSSRSSRTGTLAQKLERVLYRPGDRPKALSTPVNNIKTKVHYLVIMSGALVIVPAVGGGSARSSVSPSKTQRVYTIQPNDVLSFYTNDDADLDEIKDSAVKPASTNKSVSPSTSPRPYVAFLVPSSVKTDYKPESTGRRASKAIEPTELLVCELAGPADDVAALKARLFDWAPKLAVREERLPHSAIVDQLR